MIVMAMKFPPLGRFPTLYPSFLLYNGHAPTGLYRCGLVTSIDLEKKTLPSRDHPSAPTNVNILPSKFK